MSFGATAPVDVHFSTSGLPQVQAGLRAVQAEAAPTGEKWTMATRRISYGLEEAARHGELAGRSLREILVSSAEIGAGFGASGAIVGGLAVLGMAIYEHFTKGMEAAKKATDEAAKAIVNLVDTGNKAEIYKQMAAVWRGTPSQNFEDGIVNLKAQVDFLTQKQGRIDPFGNAKNHQMIATEEQVSLQKELDRTTARLYAQQQQYEKLLAAYSAPMPFTGTGMLPAVKSTAKAFGSNEFHPGEFGTAPDEGGYDAMTNDYWKRKMERQELSKFELKLPKIPNLISQSSETFTQMSQIGKKAGEQFVNSFADTIKLGMEAIFTKGATLGSVFKAVTGGLLSGLGAMAIDMGKESLVVLGFMSAIKKAIMAFAPELGIVAALGLIAVGGALEGLGGSMGSHTGTGGGGGYSGGGYGGGSGYSNSAQIIDRGYIDPTRSATTAAGMNARQAITNHIVVIGPNDPTAQRQLQELLRNGNRRGGIT